MIPLNFGLAIPYEDYVSYRERLEMIRPDRRPAVLLSDKQLNELALISKKHGTKINEEIAKAIDEHIKYHMSRIRIEVNHHNRYIP